MGSSVAGTTIVAVSVVEAVTIPDPRMLPANSVPFPSRETIPTGVPYWSVLAVTVTLNVTLPELLTLEVEAVRVVVEVATALFATKVSCCGKV